MRVLTPKTKQYVAVMFAPADGAAVEAALAALSERAERLSMAGAERICFAALRLSDGSITTLHEVLRWGCRDILAGAGFDQDASAHERWSPILFSPSLLDTWTAGGVVERVRFRHGEAVKIYRGERLPGEPVTITGLERIEPEPRYRVLCETGETIGVPESWLRPLGAPGGPT